MGSIVKTFGKLREFVRGAGEAKPTSAASPSVPAIEEASEDRLRRLADWCLTGRAAGAEIELFEWSRREDCPPVARVLLASLMKRRGRNDDAVAALAQPNTARDDADAEVLRMRASCFTTDDLTESARQSVLALHHAHGHRAEIGRWVRATQLPGASDTQTMPDAQVEHLAEELALRPELIPSLVAAQRVGTDAMTVLMLRQALHRLAPNLRDNTDQMLTVCQALAELALLSDDADDARRWAYRGLRLRPYSASLALLLSRVDDDPAVGPPASEVLRQAFEANPNYPDVRAALIRAENAAGEANAARRRLEQWLHEQPDHPLARQVEREIAA